MCFEGAICGCQNRFGIPFWGFRCTSHSHGVRAFDPCPYVDGFKGKPKGKPAYIYIYLWVGVPSTRDTQSATQPFSFRFNCVILEIRRWAWPASGDARSSCRMCLLCMRAWRRIATMGTLHRPSETRGTQVVDDCQAPPTGCSRRELFDGCVDTTETSARISDLGRCSHKYCTISVLRVGACVRACVVCRVVVVNYAYVRKVTLLGQPMKDVDMQHHASEHFTQVPIMS